MTCFARVTPLIRSFAPPSPGGRRNHLHGLGEDYLRNSVQRLYAVTPAGVQRAARQFIDPSKITIVAVGDRKVILDQLEAYGDVVE